MIDISLIIFGNKGVQWRARSTKNPPVFLSPVTYSSGERKKTVMFFAPLRRPALRRAYRLPLTRQPARLHHAVRPPLGCLGLYLIILPFAALRAILLPYGGLLAPSRCAALALPAPAALAAWRGAAALRIRPLASSLPSALLPPLARRIRHQRWIIATISSNTDQQKKPSENKSE